MDRAEISRRLKAARWLAGGVNAKGQPVPLETRELAERQQLADNGISRNRIEDIEQAKVDARPMELDKIAESLGMPRDWFTVEKVAPMTLDVPAAMEEVRRLSEQIAALAATPAQPPGGTPHTEGSDGSFEEAPRAHREGTR